jgi:3-deoxy-D-manno-octulosonic-acid transferase
MRQGADPARFVERLGQATAARKDGPLIWLHTASLGEAMSVGGVVKDLQARTGAAVLVTTATRTGADWVAREMRSATHQFAPIDSPETVERFLDHWRPDLAVFVEAELWPWLIGRAAARMIPLALLNTRKSRSRRRMPKTFAELLAHFSLITCQTETIRTELQDSGIAPGVLHVTGDLKAAAAPLAANAADLAEVANQIGGRPVWVAASTHPDDEQPVLAAHRIARERVRNLLLIWAPRHTGRADAIRQAATSAGLGIAQRGRGEPATPDTAIYLADTMGELGIFYRLARLVFLGGSFGPEGGHNPYEPAILGAAILTGPRHRHFDEAISALTVAGGAMVVEGGVELGETVSRLLSDNRAEEMGRAARSYVNGQSGSLNATVQLLADFLPRA